MFQYVDDDGGRHSIDSGDVNEYLRTISGREITAKDFRTSAGTNLAVLALHELNENKPTKKGTLQAIKKVAEQLGNTPSVCRKCYIHPAVLESYLAGSLRLIANGEQGRSAEMLAIEHEVIRFLDMRAAESGKTLQAALKASIKSAKSKRVRARSLRSVG